MLPFNFNALFEILLVVFHFCEENLMKSMITGGSSSEVLLNFTFYVFDSVSNSYTIVVDKILCQGIKIEVPNISIKVLYREFGCLEMIGFND